MDKTKTVFIKTYGCQMNVYDSERMADVLAEAGYSPAATPEDADLLLLNTCHIREKAAEKVYSELGRLRGLKQRGRQHGRDVKIAVGGCVAQAEGAEILKREQAVDVVVGPQSYHRLPQLLLSEKRAVDTEFPAQSKFDFLPEALGNHMDHVSPAGASLSMPETGTQNMDSRGPGHRHVSAHLPEKSGIPKVDSLGRGHAGRMAHVSTPPSAFLTVQEGCDKFCTFCVVPYTRGAEFSRPVDRIVAEAEGLVARGVKEITLLGQNVNAYHGAGPNGRIFTLAMLAATLSDIDGLKRIRYTTSHPRDMSDDLIAAHRDLPKLMPYLHLPVQAGSDRVLKAMNRKHDRAFYLRLVEQLRKARPDLALSGDFIVGFPGETDVDFEDTLRLVEAVRYASAYSFKYSPRPGTPAAEMEQVPDAVKAERLQRLQALLSDQQRAFNANMRGLVVDVLLERAGKYAGQLVGRSPWLQAVQVDAPPDMIGEIVPVTIDRVGSNSLFGTLMDEHARTRAIA